LSNVKSGDIITAMLSHTYQNGVYCMGIKVYNNLPPNIKWEFHNPRKFGTCLKHFHHAHYFYSLKEYFNIKPA
jgi:hypothetical protein